MPIRNEMPRLLSSLDKTLLFAVTSARHCRLIVLRDMYCCSQYLTLFGTQARAIPIHLVFINLGVPLRAFGSWLFANTCFRIQ